MTTFGSREIWNYTLPEDWYSQQLAGSQPPPRYTQHVGSYTSRGMCVDPQQLTMASPLSPPLDDYAFPASSYPPLSRPYIQDRDRMDYITTSQRKRSIPPTAYPDSRGRSYTLPRSSTHQTSHSAISYQTSLPTPPLSPSSTIPASVSSSSSVRTPVTITTTASNASQRFYCNHAACLDPDTGRSTKSFSRRADLQRHHQCAHETPPLLSCPRPNCSRKGDNGFTRQDHLIEHRRGYHGESIPKRGSRGSASDRKRGSTL